MDSQSYFIKSVFRNFSVKSTTWFHCNSAFYLLDGQWWLFWKKNTIAINSMLKPKACNSIDIFHRIFTPSVLTLLNRKLFDFYCKFIAMTPKFPLQPNTNPKRSYFLYPSCNKITNFYQIATQKILESSRLFLHWIFFSINSF